MSIDEMIDELKKSPTYAMSLGGKELFHSNFWAWLIEQYPQFMNVFLPDGMQQPDDALKAVKVTREEKYRDLTLYLKNGIFIIENKIKSMPTKEQLSRYTVDVACAVAEETYTEKGNLKRNAEAQNKEKIFSQLWSAITPKEREDVCGWRRGVPREEPDKAKAEEARGTKVGVLTGLPEKRPDFLESSCWDYLSYADISEKIRKIVNDLEKESRIDAYHADIIENYCKDIQMLSEVVNGLLREDLGKNLNKDKGQIFYSFENAEILKDIRFDDVYKKLKMNKFKNYMEEFHDEIFPLEDDAIFKPEIEENFTNKNPILTIRYINKETENEFGRYAIGIQIQGNQFRRFFEMPKLLGNEEKASANFNRIMEKEWFTGPEKSRGLLKGQPAKTQKRWNRYGDSFMYQYFKIKEKDSKEEGRYKDIKGWVAEAMQSDAFEKAFDFLKEQYNEQTPK